MCFTAEAATKRGFGRKSPRLRAFVRDGGVVAILRSAASRVLDVTRGLALEWRIQTVRCSSSRRHIRSRGARAHTSPYHFMSSRGAPYGGRRRVVPVSSATSRAYEDPIPFGNPGSVHLRLLWLLFRTRRGTKVAATGAHTSRSDA